MRPIIAQGEWMPGECSECCDGSEVVWPPRINESILHANPNSMSRKVGIIMGSDSDLEVMNEAAKICEEFHVEYEITVVSAHRTPERMMEYGKSARERGLKVIIAGAGGAAH